MATKNIARTVIEGGRHSFNKGERRGRQAEFRAAERAFVSRAGRDPEEAVEPLRTRVPKDFEDKLGPARRWFCTQVGRRWDAVYADIRARFDVRTTAGRHIVFDHMLRWVQHEHAVDSRHTEFVIDRRGILRHPAERRRGRVPDPPGTLRHHHSVILEWAAGRRVHLRGSRAFWFVSVARRDGALPFRQHRPLDEKERAFYDTLVPAWKEELARGLAIS